MIHLSFGLECTFERQVILFRVLAWRIWDHEAFKIEFASSCLGFASSILRGLRECRREMLFFLFYLAGFVD
jgi:hypothetical protein